MRREGRRCGAPGAVRRGPLPYDDARPFAILPPRSRDSGLNQATIQAFSSWPNSHPSPSFRAAPLPTLLRAPAIARVALCTQQAQPTWQELRRGDLRRSGARGVRCERARLPVGALQQRVALGALTTAARVQPGPPVRLCGAASRPAGRLHEPAAVGLPCARQSWHRVGGRRLRPHARCVAARVRWLPVPCVQGALVELRLCAPLTAACTAEFSADFPMKPPKVCGTSRAQRPTGGGVEPVSATKPYSALPHASPFRNAGSLYASTLSPQLLSVRRAPVCLLGSPARAA